MYKLQIETSHTNVIYKRTDFSGYDCWNFKIDKSDFEYEIWENWSAYLRKDLNTPEKISESMEILQNIRNSFNRQTPNKMSSLSSQFSLPFSLSQSR